MPESLDSEVLALIALGGNLGDRRAHLDRALELVAETGASVLRVSSYHETAPVGGPPGQPPYLNAAALIATRATPRDLLAALLAIEQTCGRVRDPCERNAPRTVDLDLLFYGNLTCAEEGLDVPHPRLHERAFVLEPLVEVAPNWRHPVLNLTVAELLTRLRTHDAR